MGFVKKFRKAARIALYVGIGAKVAKAASTFAIVEGLGGGAPAPKKSRVRGDVTPERTDPGPAAE